MKRVSILFIISALISSPSFFYSKLNKTNGVFFSIPSDTITIPESNWAHAKINLYDAQALVAQNSSPTIKICVLDSGVSSTNSYLDSVLNESLSVDFSSQTVKNYILNNTSQTDGKINFSNIPKDLNISDEIGHGTNVASIIGACGTPNNIANGICTNIEIISLKVSGSEDYNEQVKNAILYADYIGSDFINYSGGTDINPDYYSILSEYKGLMICASGNNGQEISTNIETGVLSYPSLYNADNIISVGASTLNDTRSQTSNYSSSFVDIFAPGTDIPTYNRYNEYEPFSGTSSATPFVTGVAALLKLYMPSLSPLEIKNIILSKSNKTTSNFINLCSSGGMLDALSSISFHEDCISYVSDYYHIDGKYHTAKCYCEKTTKQVHMVKSGSNICELCKGVADMGGIGFLDLDSLPKTNDGNYYLPNGIILIKNV